MGVAENESETEVLQDGIQKIDIVRESNKNRINKPVLSVVDILLSVFIVTPLVVFTWRGLWGLMDIYSQYFPPLPSFLAGGWGLIDSLMNIQFTENVVAKKEGSQWFLIIWATCFVTLVIIRCLRNAIAPPFAICLDKGVYVFRFPTMFRRQSKHGFYLFGLDCMFSVGIMGNLVVVFWKGLWIIADIILLPDDYISSSWMSTIMGLLIVGLVFRLQNCIKNLCAAHSGVAKIAIADFYIILSCISTILYWRGIWNFCYIYILPSNVELSCVLTHFIGFTFLVVLDCSNSLLVRGVYKDGKEPDGECVVFPCQYLRIILEEEDADERNI